MANSFTDLREIQTFRFQTHANEINLMLKKKTAIMGFCVAASVDWQDWSKQTVYQEIKTTAISKQLGRFLFNNKKNSWRGVRNLLKGQVFLLKNKTEEEISLSLIKKFLELKVFYLRLLLINNQLYRSDVLNTRLAITVTKTTAVSHLIVLLSSQVKSFIFFNEKL